MNEDLNEAIKSLSKFADIASTSALQAQEAHTKAEKAATKTENFTLEAQRILTELKGIQSLANKTKTALEDSNIDEKIKILETTSKLVEAKADLVNKDANEVKEIRDEIKKLKSLIDLTRDEICKIKQENVKAFEAVSLAVAAANTTTKVADLISKEIEEFKRLKSSCNCHSSCNTGCSNHLHSTQQKVHITVKPQKENGSYVIKDLNEALNKLKATEVKDVCNKTCTKDSLVNPNDAKTREDLKDISNKLKELAENANFKVNKKPSNNSNSGTANNSGNGNLEGVDDDGIIEDLKGPIEIIPKP